MHEVELVLLFVEVVEPFGAGQEDEHVGAEGGDAEPEPELAEDTVPQVVDRSVPMSHGGYRRRPCSSASKNVSASSPARPRESARRSRACLPKRARVSSRRVGARSGPGVGEALHVSLDLSVPSAPGELVDAAEQAFERVDCLVNNVSVAYQTSFDELTDEDWATMWELNVMSYVRAIKAVLPGMRERGFGRIVNWLDGRAAPTQMPNYSVTKAAVLSLSRLIADVYAKDGILCNAVTPGPTASPAGSPRTA